MNRFAVIVAGGSGTRMNTSVPKQFLNLAGKPILMHSVAAFHLWDPSAGIVIVIPKDYKDHWLSLCSENRFTIKHQIIFGGEKRFHSVFNALEILPSDGYVAIHDGVRPLVSTQLIAAAFREAKIHGNAIPSTEIRDSVRLKESDSNRPVIRENLKLIQTPQVFDLSKIKTAYRQVYREIFTDDATVLESAGEKIHLIEGEPYNIKITSQGDFAVAEAILTMRVQIP